MGLDSEGGEASCEDLNSGKLGTLKQKDLDVDRGSKVKVQKGSDDGVPAIQGMYSADDTPLIEILEGSDEYVPPKTHTCPYCDKAFNRPWRLASHILTHTNERPFKCEVPDCEKAYVSSACLYRHIKVKHSSATTYREVLKCPHPHCSMELSNRHNLKRHYKDVHQRKYPFTCQFCDKGFFRHHQFQAHQYEHTGIPPFKCPTCGVGFTLQSRLRRHQKTHRSYICDCGQNFKDSSLLRKHTMLSHSADFICDICKKTFKRKAMLEEHISVHQNKFDREILCCPYDCCPRVYFHKRNLTQHIKSSHEGKKYECTYPDCGTKLCTQQKLKEHVEFCHGKRPRPQKPLKLQRKKRCDAGKVKRSMATLLSGVILSHKEEKAILNNNSYDIKITEKGNSIPITNCTQLEEAPDHPSRKYKRKEEISSKNLKIRFASQDAVQNVDDIHKGEPWQDPEVQVNDNHACESENFVLSGKDCSKQSSKFKEVVESRMDGHQEP